MAESITRKNIDLDILDYYDGKIKNYVDNKVGTGSLTIDDTLSDTSTNPVQNKVVKQAIDNKADKTVATTSADGLMSAEDKDKLNNADDTYALKSLYGDTTINVGRKAETKVGLYSTAEGINTTASGTCSHAEGDYTTASGTCSHAEGSSTTASGTCSHAGGIHTETLHRAEFAHGEYNQSNADTLFSIGDGTADDARHNAFEITTTGGKLHDKDIATTDLIPTTLPANGGNADTVDGMHANDFITGEAIQRRTTIDDCITAGTYTVSTVYTTDLPTEFGIWGIMDVRVYGLGIFQTIKYTDTAIVICRSKIEGQIEWTKWKEISTTPIKKMTFPSVAIYEGGGGVLFSIDHGTPIAIACTSHRATQCTQFVADDTWYVLAKDAVTLDPIPAGSYSFDVWYI